MSCSSYSAAPGSVRMPAVLDLGKVIDVSNSLIAVDTRYFYANRVLY